MNLAEEGVACSVKSRTRDHRGPVPWSHVGSFSFFTLYLLPPVAGTVWEVRACLG